jgi:hypothetical protein
MPRTPIAFAACALLFVTAIALRVRDESARAAESWDRAAAAQYLDARMDVWWEKAKSLKTGSTETKCLSCHTALPYLLARPLLRKSQNIATPTAHEVRILETARQRVAYASSDQPYYDHTEDKKIESRGAEAVINAFVLTSHDLAERTGPSRETVAAMARLWAVQRQDGAWDWLNFGLEPYEVPDAVFHGATLAALAAGSEPGMRACADAKGQVGVAQLRKYLHSNHTSQRLFNKVWALLASSRLEGVLTADERQALIRELALRQRPDGGWSLNDLGTWRWDKQAAPFAPPGPTNAALLSQSDGYATGLVVYAMRQAGVGVDDSVVARGQQWLREHQVQRRGDDPAWAPWRAHSLNHDRENGGPRGEAWRRMFMSDLATAFAVMALS